ncbi:MAG: tetratricopeptide repeat protein [Pirellulales bacterium]|nr:tetratricopeptide repeat protein [Pirellulales bacterium]
MPSEGTRQLILILCLFWLFVGCKGIPPAPSHAQNVGGGNEDEYEGWLFKRLTGRQNASSPQGSASQVAANVAPTPRTTSAGDVNPASYEASPSDPTVNAAPIPPEASAGPPPSIPAALPSPKDGVSIKNMQSESGEKSGLDLADLAPERIYKNIKEAAGYGPDEKIARSAKQEGEALFREKKYKEAAKKFAAAAARWPDSPLEEDALFLKGESEFFSDQYPEAHDTFGELLKKYSNTRHLDTVMAREFAIGRYWEQLYGAKPTLPIQPNLTDGERPLFDTFGYAVQAYQRVRQNDPTGPLADDALLALGNAYFRRGQFENAAHQYDLLRKEYPNSEHQMNAHLLGLQAKMRIYQGTPYDDAPLVEGEKIAAQALTQFGDKLGEERRRVAQAHAQIQEEKANRDFQIAQYYEQRKRFGAARLYYRSIIEEFPRTRMAEQSKARLEAIGGEPDEPPDRFAWFTGLFESKK